ncbi:sensor histidine kinase [Colwellia sp. C1TZA3]|uniref:sensor histidine kinase n=1 Tax=Colwellia sp. C1TZA3 TaxID=2508879 RepID=UPI0011B96653|nr:sensor histidine kinase [Colwellia sp. C1TZA3]TWX63392.1 sensor histidine kinase [Colwellia sp. C1TZA3]
MKVTEETSEFGVIIENSGIGMTAEQLSHVGKRFYKVDTSGSIPGTGLGISLVKELINMHNGRLAIANTIGQGTIVTLWLSNIIS